MRRTIRYLGLLACVLMTGCASVTGGNVQKMYVQTQAQSGTAVTGASCVLTNDKGSWRLTSPGDASIVRSNKAMEVKCDKPGDPQGIVNVESTTRGAMFGNILVGGVVGAAIDHTSGSAYEYPAVVNVTMGRYAQMGPPPSAGPVRHDPSRPRDTPQPTPQQMMEPQASGFARLEDVPPMLGPKGREAYREWLTRPLPRAFAAGPNGFYYTANGLTPPDTTLPSDPSERAVMGCSRNAQVPCKLYAVNNTVVWTKDAPLVAAPATAAAPAPATAAVQPIAYQPPRAAQQPALIASGFARIDDVDAIPFIDDTGRSSYRDWMGRSTPKAFAISDTGHWAATWGMSPTDTNAPRDPNERAIYVCQQRSKGLPCRLYAINGSVVWTRESPQRPSP